MAEERSFIDRYLGSSFDVGIALSVVLVLTVMIIPLPAPILDILLATNISLSLLILLTSVYVQRPLEFSSFPTVLLITTLFRLSLNVATTRRILLYGNKGTAAAGHIIQAFGQFVVGGNYVVGFVVFLILVIINFVVITKGAQRIAEVAARFTLDAMPGKQMAVDADLNAGLIDEAVARKRREEIRREADFYGAMDGASKFVRGDAIAGVIITVINILGGLIIGVMQLHMSPEKAAKTFTILTIGDGLVGQIPALLISTSAGIVVSMAASSEESLGRDITQQIAGNAKVLGLGSAILFFAGIVPGLPLIPFWTLSAILGVITYITLKRTKEAEVVSEEEKAKEEAETPEEEVEKLATMIQVDPVELDLGYGLIPLVEEGKGGNLLAKVKAMRRQIALDLGIIVPPVRIRDNLQLPPNVYTILLQGVEVARGEVMMDKLLAMSPGGEVKEIEGIATKEPAFGLPAVWIAPELQDKAQLEGYTVVDPATVVVTHLSEVLKTHAHELLGRQEVQNLLDSVAKTSPKLVEDLIPNILPLGTVRSVLQNLVKEGVSIRNLQRILETLADLGSKTDDVEVLTEYVRQVLARQIVHQYIGPDGTLPIVVLDPAFERVLVNHVKKTEQGSVLALPPQTEKRLAENIEQALKAPLEKGIQPVVVVAAELRPAFRRFMDRYIQKVAVLSPLEIQSDIRVQVLGVVKWEEEDKKEEEGR